ncbi:unnamed protein product [Rhodiola kirilowii]
MDAGHCMETLLFQGYHQNILSVDINRGSTPSSSGYGSSLRGREATYQDGKTHQDVLEEYPESFVQWVTSGETLCH